jgi:hypothetical protein
MSGFFGQGKMIMIIFSKATNFLSSLTPGRWIVNTFFTGILQVKEFCQYSTQSLALYLLQVPSMFKVQTNVQFWSSPLPVTWLWNIGLRCTAWNISHRLHLCNTVRISQFPPYHNPLNQHHFQQIFTSAKQPAHATEKKCLLWTFPHSMSKTIITLWWVPHEVDSSTPKHSLNPDSADSMVWHIIIAAR